MYSYDLKLGFAVTVLFFCFAPHSIASPLKPLANEKNIQDALTCNFSSSRPSYEPESFIKLLVESGLVQDEKRANFKSYKVQKVRSGFEYLGIPIVGYMTDRLDHRNSKIGLVLKGDEFAALRHLSERGYQYRQYKYTGNVRPYEMSVLPGILTSSVVPYGDGTVTVQCKVGA